MDDPLEALYWRDEILQILYWFRGEGLGERVTAQELASFAGIREDAIQRQMEDLVDVGYARRLEETPPRYQLTDQGVREGGRRFSDLFTGLTGQAHGECSDPDCVCHTLGPEACLSDPHHPASHG